MKTVKLAEATGNYPLMIGIALDDGEFVDTLDKIYWHPAVATRWDPHTRTFAFWWSGDGGHIHIHKYLYASDENEIVRLYGNGVGIFIDDRITDKAREILNEYMKTDEYELLYKYNILDDSFEEARFRPSPSPIPLRPYDIIVEVSLLPINFSENNILGAWAYSDNEIAYCERPGSNMKQYIEQSIASGFKPNEIIAWWMDKNDYVDRVRRGTIMAPSVHRAARRALSDAIKEARAFGVS